MSPRLFPSIKKTFVTVLILDLICVVGERLMVNMTLKRGLKIGMFCCSATRTQNLK